MKIIRHGKCMKFICENCECEWQAVKKECREEHFFGNSPGYLYDCPECGKPTWGEEVRSEEGRSE